MNTIKKQIHCLDMDLYFTLKVKFEMSEEWM